MSQGFSEPSLDDSVRRQSEQSCVVSGNQDKQKRQSTYHVPSEIVLLVFLEPLQVLQDTSSGILDILLGHLQCLLQLC